MVKKVFLFPGQGSQYVGMGKKLCDNFKSASDIFNEAGEAIGADLKKMCFEGNVDELRLTSNAQPAILTTSYAMYRVFLQEEDVIPDIMAGHSLGEITALTCAEAIRFPDAVKIARRRGEFMQKAVPVGFGTMMAVNSRDVEYIENLCREVDEGKGIISVSNYNSRTQTVISGDKNAISKAEALLAGKNIETKQLNVSAPFHCQLMKPAMEMLENELELYVFSTPKCTVLSNVTAVPYNSKNDIAVNLTSQLVMPVQWVKSMQYLKKAMISYGVELGPGNVLKNLMKKNVSDIRIFSYDNKEDVLKMRKYIKDSYIPFLNRSMGIAVATRNSNWDNEAYKNGVIEPYNRIKELAQTLKSEGREPSFTEMRRAIEMLISVFRTKKTPRDVQVARFKELFSDTGTERQFADFDYEVLQ